MTLVVGPGFDEYIFIEKSRSNIQEPRNTR